MLAEKSTKQFSCLGENTENSVIFTLKKKKNVTRIDKNGEEITNNIS